MEKHQDRLLISTNSPFLFFSSNTSTIIQQVLKEVGGALCGSYDKYLCLLLLWANPITTFLGGSRKEWQKIKNWKHNFLSQVEREILIKAILQTLPVYTISIFLFLKTLRNNLASIMEKLWWGVNDQISKIQWISWKKMGSHKSLGGMGLKDLDCFNKVLLAKQLWRLVTQPHSLVASILRKKYCKDVLFLEAKVQGYHSLIWKSILASKSVLNVGLR